VFGVSQAIETVLKDKVFNDKLVQGWVDEICSSVTKELVETNKPFKYLGATRMKCSDMMSTISNGCARHHHHSSSYSSVSSSGSAVVMLNRIGHHSVVHNHAEEWRGAARRTLVLLGCGERQHGDGEVAQREEEGPQCHVCINVGGVRPGILSCFLSSPALSSRTHV
jgi:hypothetical protein